MQFVEKKSEKYGSCEQGKSLQDAGGGVTSGGRIVLIGNESDVLHSSYGHPVSDGGKK